MDDSNEHCPSFTMVVVSGLLFWWVAILAGLTIFTHLAQISALQFKLYAILSMLIAVGISIPFLWILRRHLSAGLPYDLRVLFFILMLGIACGVLSVSMRRVGRIAPEEYLYGTNPVYFIQNPSEGMGFEDRTLYSGQAQFSSVSYHTAGAYEYILGAIALLINVSYVTAYYRLAAALAGFTVPLAVFLVVTRFSRSVSGAALGSFSSMCFMVMLAEGSWTPGAYSFVRIFEGKIIFLFVVIPLFVFFSLEYLKHGDVRAWVQLFAVNTAAIGLSSTSIMVLPMLGATIFFAYCIVHKENFESWRAYAVQFLAYFSSLAYLLLFAALIAATDSIQTGQLINSMESSDFGEYLTGFVNPAFPITPWLVVFTSIAVLFFAGRKARTFLAWWMLLAWLLALNPVAARFLLIFFRGIYFRLFYIFPFLINIGVIFSSLFPALERPAPRGRVFLWSGLAAVLLGASLLMPSSIFQDDRYAFGGTINDEDVVLAHAIVNVVPKGVMLAPYPLSGAINMVSSEYPQLVSRDDNISYLLGSQGRQEELKLRLEVSAFLSDRQDDPRSLVELAIQFPELRSIVMYVNEFNSNPALQEFLSEDGFVYKKRMGRWLVLWK